MSDDLGPLKRDVLRAYEAVPDVFAAHIDPTVADAAAVRYAAEAMGKLATSMSHA